MKLWRIFTDSPLQEKTIRMADPVLRHRLIDILRLKTNEAVTFFNNSGFDYQYAVQDVNKNSLVLALKNKTKGLVPKKIINVYLSLVKKERFEWAVEKLAELGAAKIVPVVFENTTRMNLNYNRLEKIVIESCEIAGWSTIPALAPAAHFDTIATKLPKEKTFVLQSNKQSTIRRSLNYRSLKELNVVIGPEGGFNDNEKLKMKKAQFNFVSLGEQTLRSETAAVAATSLFLHD